MEVFRLCMNLIQDKSLYFCLKVKSFRKFRNLGHKLSFGKTSFFNFIQVRIIAFLSSEP